MTTPPPAPDPVRLLGDTAEMFGLIDAARRTRQIVPLFGSGISVDAGFPVAGHLCDYLVRLHWWLRVQNKGSVDTYLRRHPWPSRHDLNADLLCEPGVRPSFEQRLQREEHQLNREAMFDELRRDTPTAAYALRELFAEVTDRRALDDQPGLRGRFDRVTGRIHGYTGYRSLLNYLCDRDGNLIDAFFDHFARHRRPSTTHQFVAFVVQLLRTRLILTTNFDTFVETALRDEGLNPTVYEIARDGAVPSDQLLRNQALALVKLHGGAYALRTGFDLDERLSQGALAEYKRYFRPPGEEAPLVVALGYSGSDRRVMDILSTHLQEWAPGQGERVLWVSRDGRPPDLLTEIARPYARGDGRPPVALCAYRDARMFLHELYQRLTWQHPVSRHHYRALTPLLRTPRAGAGLLGRPPAGAAAPARDPLDPERVQDIVADADAFRRHLDDAPGFIFCADAEGSGSSSLLAKACRTTDWSHLTIWIDAAEFRSRASMVGVIQESLYPYDRHLNRVSRPMLFHDVDYVLRRCEETSQGGGDGDMLAWIEEWEEEVALRWVANALRRGRYVLAIDSLGEFGSGHPASRPAGQPATDADAGVDRQVEKAYRFLAKLLDKRRYDLGESKVLIAVTRRQDEPAEAGRADVAGAARSPGPTRVLLDAAEALGVRCYRIPPPQRDAAGTKEGEEVAAAPADRGAAAAEGFRSG